MIIMANRKIYSRAFLIAVIGFIGTILLSGCNGNENGRRDHKDVSDNSGYHEIADIDIQLWFGEQCEKLNNHSSVSFIQTEKHDGKDRIQVKEKELREFVRALAEKYNTYQEKINLKTQSGSEIQLNNYGLGWILDEEYAAEAIKKMVDKRERAELHLTDHSKNSNRWWTRQEGEYTSSDEQNSQYIEVSIQMQHFWLVENGKPIMESDVVTGNPNTGHSTPTGVYHIFDKQKNAVLSGEDYEITVSYWIEFTEAIGLHDAVWQSEFGGEVYRYNGSHGCINLPLKAAEKLYGLSKQDMQVFIY